MLDLTPYLPVDPVETTEVVTVLVDGAPYTAFVSVQVRAGYDEAARAFELDIAAEAGASATHAIFHGGAEVSVFASGNLLLSGHVDQKQPHLSARRASIRVTGRSKSADLIDSDVDHPTGYFENKDPAEIGAALADGYGARIITDRPLRKLEQYSVTPGESIYRAVEKMARRQGKTLAGTPEGHINITSPNGERHAGGLIEGQNILVANGDHNWSNRHSKYSFRGQRAAGHGAKRLHLVASAKDGSVKRKRHKAVVHDDDGTIDDLKTRAKARRDRAAGNALKASISTVGFRDEAGAIWVPGRLIWVESPFLDITQDMLIEAVDFSQSDQGTISLLQLVDPRAYGGNGAGGGKGNKSGPEYDIDDAAPTDDTPADVE